MLTQICAFLRNYFIKDDTDIHYGTFKIEGGRIATLPFLTPGQYFRIVDSALNDGVYMYPVGGLADETFTGQIWAMRIPPALIALSAEIKDWTESTAKYRNSPYKSERFDTYAYELKSGDESNGGTLSWQKQFSAQLSPYRRI